MTSNSTKGWLHKQARKRTSDQIQNTHTQFPNTRPKIPNTHSSNTKYTSLNTNSMGWLHKQARGCQTTVTISLRPLTHPSLFGICLLGYPTILYYGWDTMLYACWDTLLCYIMGGIPCYTIHCHGYHYV